jgi:hypothetical protein
LAPPLKTAKTGARNKALNVYVRKRDLARTPEPAPKPAGHAAGAFAVQKHAARPGARARRRSEKLGGDEGTESHGGPPDLALGAFYHLFPPNQMICANHTLRSNQKRASSLQLCQRRTRRALREPVSVNNRTGLCPTEMEIEKWRPETGAQNPPRTDRNGKNCRTETEAHQPNPRECRGFSLTGK